MEKHERKQVVTQDLPKSQARVGDGGYRQEKTLKNFVVFVPSWCNFQIEVQTTLTARTAHPTEFPSSVFHPLPPSAILPAPSVPAYQRCRLRPPEAWGIVREAAGRVVFPSCDDPVTATAAAFAGSPAS